MWSVVIIMCELKTIIIKRYYQFHHFSLVLLISNIMTYEALFRQTNPKIIINSMFVLRAN